MFDNDDKLALNELEMIEPELFFRFDLNAVQNYTESVSDYIKENRQQS